MYPVSEGQSAQETNTWTRTRTHTSLGRCTYFAAEQLRRRNAEVEISLTDEHWRAFVIKAQIKAKNTHFKPCMSQLCNCFLSKVKLHFNL